MGGGGRVNGSGRRKVQREGRAKDVTRRVTPLSMSVKTTVKWSYLAQCCDVVKASTN